MELSNTMNAAWSEGKITSDAWSEAVESLLVLLAPMAPHVTEELWERTGRPFSIHDRLLPEWDPALAADETVTLVVQVNGRVRDRIELPAPLTEKDASAAALDSPRVQTHTAGQERGQGRLRISAGQARQHSREVRRKRPLAFSTAAKGNGIAEEGCMPRWSR